MKILAFGIHPDDVELGCGGTVVLAARAGHRVTLVDLSDGAAASNGSPEKRAAEAADAAKLMGAADRLNLALPDTELQSEASGQVLAVVAVLREIRPDVVLYSTGNDPHPDHAAGAQLIARALYLSGVHGYEPSSEAWRVRRVLVYAVRRRVRADLVVDISTTYDTKIDAIRAHRSQFDGGAARFSTPINDPDFLGLVEARARLAGAEIGVRYGECFQLMRPLHIGDLGFLGG